MGSHRDGDMAFGDVRGVGHKGCIKSSEARLKLSHTVSTAALSMPQV